MGVDFKVGNDEENRQFWSKMLNPKICFDDVKAEKTINKFGKHNLMEEILYLRADDYKLTHCTCNYHKDYPNDLQFALKEFYSLYSPRVFDRIFQMFNIIQFNGKSLR